MKKELLNRFLRFTWIVMLAASVMMVACNKDDDDDDDDDDNGTIVLDGFYIKGAATSFDGFDSKGMMSKTRNEVTQEERATLYEIYIALKGGTDFSIVEVAGSDELTYGPSSDFAKITEPTTDEPQGAPFWRGGYEETSDAFSVPDDALYHIAIDTELGKLVVAKVGYWGVIGGATVLGWGDDTQLPSQGFDLNSMTFKATEIQLSNSEFKFRYSGGWKIELDTLLDLGGGNKGVKINTNYGGSVSDLVPGGDNIANETPGIYTIEMVWTLGEGYTATLTKTADLPKTDWTGVALELVGTAVSDENPNAVADPSSWNWGNVLQDDNGEPTADGDVYTWNWTDVILEDTVGGAGFKIRTLNGEPPANDNGANFDAGYDYLDVDNSSSFIYNLDGNLSTLEYGHYNIEIVIDAANQDSKVITITENK